MTATLAQILDHAWPDRGGWRTYGDEILGSGDGGPIPTPEEIEAARPAAEAALLAQAEAAAAALASRKVWPGSDAFLAEFTLPETAAISLSTDPVIAALRLILASWRGEVWSDDPRIELGLSMLQQSGIIDEARAAEIVSTT